MRTRSILILAGTLCMGLGGLSLNWADMPIPNPKSQPISPPAIQDEADPHFVRYTLKPGTALRVLLQTPVSTAINQAGDPIEGIMTQNLYLGSKLLLSKNTHVTGVVSRLEPAIQGMDAILGIHFTEIQLDNGEKLPLEAHVRTDHPQHIWGGHVTPGTKPMVSTQHVWGIGDYNRIVLGGPRAMGANIEFLPGEQWTLILEQPLTLVVPREQDE